MNPVVNILGFKMRINWYESHHLYWGILASLGVIPMCMSTNRTIVFLGVYLFALGVYVAIDDIYQHHRQVLDPGYHSPVHNWYGRIYKYKLVRYLNDKVSGFIHSLKG